MVRLCSVLNQGLSHPLGVLVTEESDDDVTFSTLLCVVSRWNAEGSVGFLVAGCRYQLLADVKQLEPVNLPLAEVSFGSSVYGDPPYP